MTEESGPPLGEGTEQELDDRARAHRLHERTGEIELLISGALVYSLLQIPGLLGHFTDQYSSRLGPVPFAVLNIGTMYIRLIVLTLIASFSFHLVTRAYWVGLIGLDSVFPEGINWNKLNYGPLAKEVYRERIPSIPRMARKADDLASSIFSFAFWMVILFLFSVVASGGAVGVWYGITRFAPDFPVMAVAGVFVLLAILPALAISLDKAVGHRVSSDGTLARGIRAIISGAFTVAAGPLVFPVQFTLFTRVKKKVIWPLAIGMFTLVMFGLYGSEFLRAGTVRVSGTDVFPLRPGPRTVAQSYFANSRDALDPDPYVQGDIISDAYVRLTVPIMTARLSERVESYCPDLEPAGKVGVVRGVTSRDPVDSEYERALVECVGVIWSVTVDGVPVAPEWDLYWTDRSGVTAIIAYLSTGSLLPGAHTLRVEEGARMLDAEQLADLKARGDDLPRPRVTFIRFRTG